MAAITYTFARKLEHTQWTAAIYAAFIAGLTFIVLQTLIAGLIQGYSFWLPVRMIAAIALGDAVLGAPGVYVTTFLVAFLIHFGLSLMTAWILAPIIQDTAPSRAVLLGAAAGLVIYLVNFYLLTFAYTWFEGLRGWATLANHLIFGAVMAWTYVRRST